MFKRGAYRAWLWVCFSSLILFSCGYPAANLTAEEKAADLEWIFATFERNYAPLEWKRAQFGLDIKKLKADCLAESAQTQSNDEFRALVHRCVSAFQDAHTSANQSGSLLPETAKVAHLGFTTRWTELKIEATESEPEKVIPLIAVKGLLPTTRNAQFPLQTGMYIAEVDGRPVLDVLNKDIVPYLNVGQGSTNLALAATYFANRSTVKMPMPKKDEVTLTLYSVEATDPYHQKVTLPWTKQDLFAFMKEQQNAVPTNAKTQEENGEESKQSALLPFLSPNFIVGYDFLQNFINEMEKLPLRADKRVEYLLKNTFRAFRIDPFLEKIHALTAEEDPTDSLFSDGVRTFPTRWIKLNNNSALVAALIAAPNTKGKFIGYIRFSSFSSAQYEELKKMVPEFLKFNIMGLVIDLLDNGGGSLVDGLRMVDLLSDQDVEFPKMQFGLNDNWLNSFRSEAYFSSSDAERTWAKKILTQLEADRAAGKRLSRPLESRSLSPFELTANKEDCIENETCLSHSLKKVILVNEFCASMCDIFASTFKDNKLGEVVGSKTMGAGGNVTNHVFSPISKFMLSQTESLVVDINGQYIENQGIEPTIATQTLEDRANFFSETLLKGIEAIDPTPATP